MFSIGVLFSKVKALYIQCARVCMSIWTLKPTLKPKLNPKNKPGMRNIDYALWRASEQAKKILKNPPCTDVE